MKKGNHWKMRNRENGSVVIEATLSLSFFMFLIVTLLTFINLCTAQARIAVALNESAKEFSQYGYLYSLTGLNETQQRKYAEGDVNRVDIDTAVDAANEAKDAFETIAGTNLTDPESIWGSIQTASATKDDLKAAAESIEKNMDEHKETYITGLKLVLGNEIEEGVKGAVGGAIVKGLMRKHLRAESGQNPDQYLKKLGVVKGMRGLNMFSSSIFTNGSDDITFVCKYDVRVIKLLNIDVCYHMSQVAKTMAWSGNSLVRETDSSDGSSTGDSEEDPEPDYDAIRQKMVDEFGEGAINDIEEAYGKENTSKWDEDTWRYYIDLYTREDKPAYDAEHAAIRKKMVDKYGEGAVSDIEKEKGKENTTKWSEDDWEYYIDLYTRDDSTNTEPSRGYDSNAEPGGTPTKIRKKDDPDTKRSLQRENEAAKTLAQNGYDVEQNPNVEGTTRNPDYKIEGKVFDCYAPAESTKVKNIRSTIDEKVNVKKQADRIVLNLDDWKGDIEELKSELNKNRVKGLKEVLAVKDGKVIRIYP